MQAISLWQPYASAIALGAKRIETRPWGTSYRGPLAIHAAQNMTEVFEILRRPELHELWCRVLDTPPMFLKSKLMHLPKGCIVATCRLVNVEPTEVAMLPLVNRQDEFRLGNYTPGRYAWHLADVVRLAHPFKVRGQQRLFPVELPREVHR